MESSKIAGVFQSRVMTERQQEHAQDIKLKATELLDLIEKLDGSREKSIAITELQTSVMYAVRATAISGGF